MPASLRLNVLPHAGLLGRGSALEVMLEAMQNVVQLFPLTQGIQLMKASFLGCQRKAGC